MNDTDAIVLLLIVPTIGVITLLTAARSRALVADHSLAARRFGIVGGALGGAVAVFWGGRLLGIW